MAPPYDGNQLLPFGDLVALEKIDETTFRSIALPFSPGGFGRAYGGHVYAQAVWAAAQTVGEGFVNVSGLFLLAGLCDVPFVYTVTKIRDGKSYCTRGVQVTQAKGQGVCFTCTCSFKTPEVSDVDYQDNIDLWKQYAMVLKTSKESDWPVTPAADFPFYWNHMAESGTNELFPGLDARKVDMTEYNASLQPLDRRQLLFYQLQGCMNADSNPNLHACAHLYASDINSLYVVANNLGVGHRFTILSSIAHNVVLHCDPKDMLMQTPDGERPWYCKEDWTDRAAGGRGLYHSRIIGPGGRHIATTLQEGMIRLGPDAKAQHKSLTKLMVGNGRDPKTWAPKL